VKNAEIKIVGAVSDENALEEIQDIAKVFALEQRMKDCTRPLKNKRLVKKSVIIPVKKPLIEARFLHTIEPRILVKGLY
jgi:hypothetical protein